MKTKESDYTQNAILDYVVSDNLDNSVVLLRIIGCGKDWDVHYDELHAQLWAERKLYP